MIPAVKAPGSVGRSCADDRGCLDAIFYVLRTGPQRKAAPREYGAASTVPDRFQEWRAAGFFDELWIQALCEFDA